jgi:hypothetical protein
MKSRPDQPSSSSDTSAPHVLTSLVCLICLIHLVRACCASYVIVVVRFTYIQFNLYTISEYILSLNQAFLVCWIQYIILVLRAEQISTVSNMKVKEDVLDTASTECAGELGESTADMGCWALRLCRSGIWNISSIHMLYSLW